MSTMRQSGGGKVFFFACACLVFALIVFKSCGGFPAGIPHPPNALPLQQVISLSLPAGIDSGRGTITFTEDREYYGDLVGGKPHGRGKFKAPDGYRMETEEETYRRAQPRPEIGWYPSPTKVQAYAVYYGDWVNGKRQGQGTQSTGAGDSYSGDFTNDQFGPNGTYTWADGSKYVGGWKDSKRHGNGVFTKADGLCYEGPYVNDLYEGKGKMKLSNGGTYVGEFKSGKFHGNGTLTVPGPKGCVCEGEWKKGYQVKGKERRTSGLSFEGSFSEDSPANGTLVWPDGRKYTGSVRNWLPNGSGTMFFTDGSKHEGTFVNGQPDGKGVLYKADGSKTKGTWINGILQNP